MDPDLVTLVAQIHAIANERGDEPVVLLCEALGQRLIAEAEKEVMPNQPEPGPDDAQPPVQGEPGAEILALKQQLNDARVRLAYWVHNPQATKCPECIARKARAAEAQKKWREKHIKKAKRAKKSLTKDTPKVVN